MFETIVDSAANFLYNASPLFVLAIMFGLSVSVFKLIMRVLRGSSGSSDVPYVSIGGLESGVRSYGGAPGSVRVASDVGRPLKGFAKPLVNSIGEDSVETSGEVMSDTEERNIEEGQRVANAYYASVAKPYLKRIKDEHLLD